MGNGKIDMEAEFRFDFQILVEWCIENVNRDEAKYDGLRMLSWTLKLVYS